MRVHVPVPGRSERDGARRGGARLARAKCAVRGQKRKARRSGGQCGGPPRLLTAAFVARYAQAAVCIAQCQDGNPLADRL